MTVSNSIAEQKLHATALAAFRFMRHRESSVDGKRNSLRSQQSTAVSRLTMVQPEDVSAEKLARKKTQMNLNIAITLGTGKP
jgi:hypothetical protein